MNVFIANISEVQENEQAKDVIPQHPNCNASSFMLRESSTKKYQSMNVVSQLSQKFSYVVYIWAQLNLSMSMLCMYLLVLSYN